jgi:NTE family protein
MINATCHETGKNWRFEYHRMGDHVSGYAKVRETPLCDALAASAALPPLVGPLVVDTSARRWFDYPEELTWTEEPTEPGYDWTAGLNEKTPLYSKVHVWDGGVCDNLGVEALHNFDTGWRTGVDFLIVSDASGKGQSTEYQPGPRALIHIITGIVTAQIRALRARSVVERMKSHEEDPGALPRIGETCEEVREEAGRRDEIDRLRQGFLTTPQAEWAENVETTARQLSEDVFDTLFRHGFEVADHTLYA